MTAQTISSNDSVDKPSTELHDDQIRESLIRALFQVDDNTVQQCSSLNYQNKLRRQSVSAKEVVSFPSAQAVHSASYVWPTPVKDRL